MENKSVVINQFDGTTKLLRVDIKTGRREIVSADKFANDKFSFGLFEVEREGENIESVALLATPDGPLLFLNEMQYRPEINKTKIKLRDDGKFSNFRILHEENFIFGLFYEQKFGIGLHPYNNNREDIDFYYWLSKNINNPKFYEIYTKEMQFIN